MNLLRQPCLIILVAALFGSAGCTREEQRSSLESPPLQKPISAPASSPQVAQAAAVSVPGEALVRSPARKQMGMTLSPAIALAQQLSLGSKIDLSADDKFIYQIQNHSTDAIAVQMLSNSPLKAGVRFWEYGYEPIPDPTWLTLTPDDVGLGPNGAMPVRVQVTIPDVPENANRRFVACVTMKLGSDASFGASLALSARLLIETEPRFVTGTGAGELTAIPSTIAVNDLAPGVAGARLLQLTNHRQTAVDLIMRRLPEVEPRMEKQIDYLGATLTEAPWFSSDTTFHLEPEETKTVRLAITIPADAITGRPREDLLFFGDAAAFADIDRTNALADHARSSQPQVVSVRLRYVPLAADAVKP